MNTATQPILSDDNFNGYAEQIAEQLDMFIEIDDFGDSTWVYVAGEYLNALICSFDPANPDGYLIQVRCFEEDRETNFQTYQGQDLKAALLLLEQGEEAPAITIN